MSSSDESDSLELINDLAGLEAELELLREELGDAYGAPAVSAGFAA